MEHHRIDESYWLGVWRRFRKHRLGMLGLYLVIFFCLVGIYAPFLASSKPLVVNYDGEWYFPLFRYLFYRGFFTKRLDIFFNLLMFTAPLALLFFRLFRSWPRIRSWLLVLVAVMQFGFFGYYSYMTPKDPATSVALNKQRQKALKVQPLPSWYFDLQFMTPYAKLNAVLRYQQRLAQQEKFERYSAVLGKLPTLWQMDKDHDDEEIKRSEEILIKNPYSVVAKARIAYIKDKRRWLEEQVKLLTYEVNPLIRPFHWEDDAGGSQALNRRLPWLDLTRINRKDLMAALIFGVRISLVVGLLAVSLAMSIGIPIGAFAGYYGGNFDIVVSRMLEIWESMPTFFMLLMVVAITQSKSIFLVIAVIGVFGWTGFSRYIRGEFFKQRNLPYVEACHAMGFNDRYVMFSHILPNAIPPLLTLLPFAVMGAITSEAGLSFLGLGEEGSCSWGVLMDEGRSAFPAESYLLWPPAILLTILLVAIALVGDALRDTLDPKLVR